MSTTLYSLLWYPPTRALEAIRFAERPLPGRDAVLLHRRHSPNLAMGAAYAEVGVDLLPPSVRPSAGDGVRLLWPPLLPSRCLMTAREEETGVLRITYCPDSARDPQLSEALVDLEVECASVFDSVFHCSTREHAELASRLAAVQALAVDIIGRFTAHGSARRLGGPGGGS